MYYFGKFRHRQVPHTLFMSVNWSVTLSKLIKCREYYSAPPLPPHKYNVTGSISADKLSSMVGLTAHQTLTLERIWREILCRFLKQNVDSILHHIDVVSKPLTVGSSPTKAVFERLATSDIRVIL